MKLEGLQLWIDPQARTGPESMAVDEWLHGNNRLILRIYRWQGEWGSLGYFGSLAQARYTFPEIQQWVRRRTGGGIVDHRGDWTYSLVIPSAGNDQRLGGAKIYQTIHQALAETLQAEGLNVRLCDGDLDAGLASCFDNPVAYDLVDNSGRKFAGAGQKRNKAGLLHQGSVALQAATRKLSRERAERLADALSGGKWSEASMEIPADTIQALIDQRYGQVEWTERRP